MNKIVAFLKDEAGATAIEYGLLAGLIGIAAIVGMTALGSAINTNFSAVAGSVTTAGSGS